MIYKHLKIKDLNKIQEKRLAMRKARKTFMLLIIATGIVICFGIGLFYFYIKLNNNEQSKKNEDTKNIGENIKNDIVTEKIPKTKAATTENLNNDCEFANTDFSEWNKTAPEELIIVNQANPLINFSPKLKLVNGKKTNIIAAECLENLLEDARQQKINIWVVSAYRTQEHQKKLFENQIKYELENGAKTRDEAEKKARCVVAAPGQSEHELGLAFDFNSVESSFSLEPACKWLENNAHKYGFSERYKSSWEKITGVKPEPWHYRYVGIENSKKIKKVDKPLESYILENFINITH
ncbi:MAG: M15 family metallopeptidase [Oscillospiraceae bacterium]|jgi:D-alanyl-D-alanine carboxypeptidase|nr:M15 family metallopeptidase [Oscillospiraceae bacterium]